MVTLTRHGIPDFAENPTVTSIQSGSWFDPTTWSSNAVPADSAIVRVDTGHTVTYGGVSAARISALGVEGTLTFSTSIPSELNIKDFLVYENGTLNIGTATNPVTSNVDIIFSDIATIRVTDPNQWGTGLLLLGEVNIHGATMPRTWIDITIDPLEGDTSVTLEASPIGWKAGDIIIFPGTTVEPLTRLGSGNPSVPSIVKSEERTISSISGNVINFTVPLVYDHKGGRDINGVLVGMPHAGNLSRNVTFSSENPNGVRGHILTGERAKFSMMYAELKDLGRTTIDALNLNRVDADGVITHYGTNIIGRYSMHMHHLMGPLNPTDTGYQFFFEGNSIFGGEKWGLAVHNSHWGMVRNNVIYDVQGSSIMTEQGNEKGNEFRDNFMVKVGEEIESVWNPLYGGVRHVWHQGVNILPFADYGWEGTHLWFVGNDHIVTGNVMANAKYANMMFSGRPAPGAGFDLNYPNVPLHRGADIDDPSHWYKYAYPEVAPSVIEVDNNVGYASSVGFWASIAGDLTAPGNPIKNTLNWNIKQRGAYVARNRGAAFDGFTLISDQAVSNAADRGRHNDGVFMASSTYHSGGNSFTNFRIEGFTLGVDLPQTTSITTLGFTPALETVFTNGHLQNYINMRETSTKRGSRRTVLTDVSMALNPGSTTIILRTPRNLLQYFGVANAGNDILNLSTFDVINHQKIPGNDFGVYFAQQAQDYVMLERRNKQGVLYSEQNCPTLGLTNAECMLQHGVATMGSVATCDPAVTPQEADFLPAITCPANGGTPPIVTDKVLTLGVLDTSNHGNTWLGLVNTTGLITASFQGTAGDITLSVEAYDVDFVDEVEVLLNGSSIGHLSVGIEILNGGDTFTITAAQQLAGQNIITFENTDAAWTWGITNVMVEAIPTATDITLALGVLDTSQHGNNWLGLTNPTGMVTASFQGTTEDVNLSVEAYDMDFADEMQVLLNGTHIGFLTMAPGVLNGGDTFLITASQQLPGQNVITFQNQNAAWYWGITNVLVELNDVILTTADVNPLIVVDIMEERDRLVSLSSPVITPEAALLIIIDAINGL